MGPEVGGKREEEEVQAAFPCMLRQHISKFVRKSILCKIRGKGSVQQYIDIYSPKMLAEYNHKVRLNILMGSEMIIY